LARLGGRSDRRSCEETDRFRDPRCLASESLGESLRSASSCRRGLWPHSDRPDHPLRSVLRRVGNACVSTCFSLFSPFLFFFFSFFFSFFFFLFFFFFFFF